MKKTLVPKLFAFILCLLCWAIWPRDWALPANFVILATLMSTLTFPVFRPRSNFYIPTLSSAPNQPGLVAFTFDDGPDPRYTPQILDFLDREGISATFFVVGARVAEHPELVRDMIARGHIVGNHSYRHGFDFHFSLSSALHRDLDAFDDVMDEVIGKKCRLFRSPQGFRTPLLADVLRARKLVCVGWSARGFDTVRSDANAIVSSLIKKVASGGIMLLHDGGGLGGSEAREPTLKALPKLVASLRDRGLAFERLDKLLGTEAYFVRE
ncbi:MAG: polysaccharide deacetylase family protein [Chitinophagaceae bacterium]|nr:polysaccharide deacetylase family protein [Oligoflexus sp.]